MDTDLDTLATALYVTTDDLLPAHPEQVPDRPEVGFGPQITDAEMVTLAVIQAVLGFGKAKVLLHGTRTALAEQPLIGKYRHAGAGDDHDECVVPVTWLNARSQSDAYWQKGMFASQHSACKLRQEFTLSLLQSHFGIGGE